MEAIRMVEVAARVVAWHNRHPLARRITPDDVGAVGVVALPFATPGAAAAHAPGQDAPAGGDPGPWRALFGADWMYRARRTMAARLPAWVREHGVVAPAGFDGWPRRQIDAELPRSHRADADGLTGRTLQHVLSTVVECDGQRTRVLVAPRARAARDAVFGSRQWSAVRVCTAAALAAGILAALVALGAAPRVTGAAPEAPTDASAQTTMQVAAAASDAGHRVDRAPGTTAVAAPPIPSAAMPTVRVAAPDPPPPEAASAPAAQPAADRPAPLAPAAARAVELRPRLSDAERLAAREAGERARLERATRDAQDAVAAQTDRPAAPSSAAVAPAAPPAATPQRVAAAGATASPAPFLAETRVAAARPDTTDARPHFAIATRAMASRAEAQAQEALLRGLLASQAMPYPTRLELMPAQGRWRAVWWPHPDRDLAEGLLLLARQRGLRVELVEF